MKVEFLSKLDVESFDNGKWILLEAFCVKIDEEVICVPSGYETDFASIPRLPFVFLIFGNTATRSSVIHDWLYTLGTRPREWCDEVFREAMKLDGLSAWRRQLMYMGVRAGGAGHFHTPSKD